MLETGRKLCLLSLIRNDEHHCPKSPHILTVKVGPASEIGFFHYGNDTKVSNLIFFTISMSVFASFVTQPARVPFSSVIHVRKTGFCSRISATCFTIEMVGKHGETARSIAKPHLQIWLLLTVYMNR